MRAPENLRAFGLRILARVPWRCWQPLVVAAAAGASFTGPGPARHWAANHQVLAGRRPSRREVRRALVSWARNWVETLQVQHWDVARINRTVLIHPDDEHRLKTLAAEPGAVLALPHSGSWDLAGAWACANGMPVSSVAEELVPEEFELFLRFREALGMRIYGHRDPRALPRLIQDAREGRTVCLLADRDFSRKGVPVTWQTATGPVEATMPPGPAHVAISSGTVLLGVVSTYEGPHMRLVIGEPILPDPNLPDRTAQAQQMTQELCDFFASELRRHPHDWHMVRPFFQGHEQERP